MLAAGTVAALLATGCETTQQKSARAQVQAERVLATRKPVLVKHANPQVQAERVSVLRSGRRTAIVVLLHNSGAQPVSDLPISLRALGGRYLNRRANLGYFQTHV
ncbi:MAG TPA: hypothetical protein VJU79_10635, partial [Candidatus Dormibacteraeota bacterium]|nr:hypothetical protein [Candidatus Dormibacteraeota bacterium]